MCLFIFLRYISPSTPLFPNGTKTSKKPLENEVTPNQQQPRSREGQTPGKTPAFNNIRRNLCLDKEIIPTPMPFVCKLWYNFINKEMILIQFAL